MSRFKMGEPPPYPWTIYKAQASALASLRDTPDDREPPAYQLGDLPAVRVTGTPQEMLLALCDGLRRQLVAQGQIPLDWGPDKVLANVVLGGEPFAQAIMVAIAGELARVQGQLEEALRQRNVLADEIDTVSDAGLKVIEQELPDLRAQLERALRRIDELELQVGGHPDDT